MNRFSQIYCKSTETLKDSERFRVRLSQWLWEELDNHSLGAAIARELGHSIQSYQNAIGTWTYDIANFIKQAAIGVALDIITVAYNLLRDRKNYSSWGSIKADEKRYFNGISNQQKFLEFVNVCFKEENLCYLVSGDGIVHYSPDIEFHALKETTLKCLNDARYAAVKSEFIRAYEALDQRPPNTKNAIRSVFESLEILCKLIVNPQNQKTTLGKIFITSALTQLLKEHYQDNTDKIATGDLTESFTSWVTAMHNYRHGQKIEIPSDPPLDLTIMAVSTGAAFLRWLIGIDRERLFARK